MGESGNGQKIRAFECCHLASHANVVTFWSREHVELALENKKAAINAA